MEKTASAGFATPQQIGQITRQASAWNIDKGMLLQWMKRHDSETLASLSHEAAQELIDTGLEQIKREQGNLPASAEDKGMIRRICHENKMLFAKLEDAMRKSSKGWTKDDCKRARELIRAHASTRVDADFDAEKAERDYYLQYGSTGA